MDLDGRGGQEELGGVEEGGTVVRACCVIKESLFIKGTKRIFALLFLTQLLGRMFDFLRCNFFLS